MRTSREISNSDDVIDSRDVIARIDELEQLWNDEEITEANGADPQRDEAGNVVVKKATCGECGKTWNDALMSGSTPAPSARCPYEGIHGELAELAILRKLAEEAERGDWKYGETLIRKSYFQTYAQELAEDIGAINKDASWPNNFIDWDAATDALKMDYTEVDFDGVPYLVHL